MLVSKISVLTGSNHEMEIDIKPEKLITWYLSGKTAKDAFPSLTDEQHTFLSSGITPSEMKKYKKKKR